ncbi:MAG TPA: hypothetical protein VM532_03795 [Burkholderiales bacterium]|nr:hypothetical protein [Burkholderiales bacterium]
MANENEDPIALVPTGDEVNDPTFSALVSDDPEVARHWLGHLALLVAMRKDFQQSYLERQSNETSWQTTKIDELHQSLIEIGFNDTDEPADKRVTKGQYFEILDHHEIEYETRTITPDVATAAFALENTKEAFAVAKNNNNSLLIHIGTNANIDGTELHDEFVLIQKIDGDTWRLTPGSGRGETPIELSQTTLMNELVRNEIDELALVPDGRRSIQLERERTRTEERTESEELDRASQQLLQEIAQQTLGEITKRTAPTETDNRAKRRRTDAGPPRQSRSSQQSVSVAGAGSATMEDDNFNPLGDDYDGMDLDRNEEGRAGSPTSPLTFRRGRQNEAGGGASQRYIGPVEPGRKREQFKYNPQTGRVEADKDSATLLSAKPLYKEVDPETGQEFAYFDPKDAVPKPQSQKYLPMNILPFLDSADLMRFHRSIADPADPTGQTTYPIVDISYSMSDKSKDELKEDIEEYRKEVASTDADAAENYSPAAADGFIQETEADTLKDLIAVAEKKDPPSADNFDVTELPEGEYRSSQEKKNGHPHVLTYKGEKGDNPLVMAGLVPGAHLVELDEFNERMDYHDAHDQDYSKVKGFSYYEDRKLITAEVSPATVVEVSTFGALLTRASCVGSAVGEETYTRGKGRGKKNYTRHIVDEAAVNSRHATGTVNITVMIDGKPTKIEPPFVLFSLIGLPKLENGHQMKVRPSQEYLRDIGKPTQKPDDFNGPFKTWKKAGDAFIKLQTEKSRTDTRAQKDALKAIVAQFIKFHDDAKDKTPLQDANVMFRKINEWKNARNGDERDVAVAALTRFAEMQFPNYQFDMTKTRPTFVMTPATKEDYVNLKADLYDVCREAAATSGQRVDMGYLEPALKTFYKTIAGAIWDSKTPYQALCQDISLLDDIVQKHRSSPLYTEASDDSKVFQDRAMARVSDLLKHEKLQSPEALRDERSRSAVEPSLLKVPTKKPNTPDVTVSGPFRSGGR